jgi:hypothetical protein
MRASERQRASGQQRPAWPGNAMIVLPQPFDDDLDAAEIDRDTRLDLYRRLQQIRQLENTIAHGVPPGPIIAEMLGKGTGCSAARAARCT